ncbi:hypothetical protein NQ315_007269 [Exocentrus adspersus]|uniref:Uncharacterized protein n=1 Tax=Exocentrus adspersus TaxID=1586481 RepID=A0AAV8WE46_9CUCU|nr:hypothetical protein NQ315_007269 [Exocentrus adspersus]
MSKSAGETIFYFCGFASVSAIAVILCLKVVKFKCTKTSPVRDTMMHRVYNNFKPSAEEENHGIQRLRCSKLNL